MAQPPAPNQRFMQHAQNPGAAHTSGTQKPTAAQARQQQQVHTGASAPAGGPPASLLQEPPKQADVTLEGGQLTVHADNASLTQILESIASNSGMKIDGMSADQRIFGTYGPGNPHDVLQSLLDGSGYNVMMVGSDQSGAPKQLYLSPRSERSANGPQAAQVHPPQPQGEDDAGADDADQDVDTAPPIEPPVIQRPGFNPPPPNGEPNNGAPDQQQGVRTPQQMLEQLQQIRQQQMMMQQQQQQQPQQPVQMDSPQN